MEESLYVTYSKRMREYTCGELREIAKQSRNPKLAGILESISKFPDHLHVTVQVDDVVDVPETAEQD